MTSERETSSSKDMRGISAAWDSVRQASAPKAASPAGLRLVLKIIRCVIAGGSKEPDRRIYSIGSRAYNRDHSRFSLSSDRRRGPIPLAEKCRGSYVFSGAWRVIQKGPTPRPVGALRWYEEKYSRDQAPRR